jgi:hypothetical protein
VRPPAPASHQLYESTGLVRQREALQ